MLLTSQDRRRYIDLIQDFLAMACYVTESLSEFGIAWSVNAACAQVGATLFERRSETSWFIERQQWGAILVRTVLPVKAPCTQKSLSR
jgi:hypothetical protein